jgi:hypothetical protein
MKVHVWGFPDQLNDHVAVVLECPFDVIGVDCLFDVTERRVLLPRGIYFFDRALYDQFQKMVSSEIEKHLQQHGKGTSR